MVAKRSPQTSAALANLRAQGAAFRAQMSALEARDAAGPASGMPRPPAEVHGDGSGADIGSTGVPGPEKSAQASEEWQVRITAADGTGFTIPADAESAHRTADQWRASLASADVEFLVEAEQRFVGAWEPVADGEPADE